MKLKKIASLALAGVMAVSMLAGCAGKTGTTEDGTTVTVTTDSSAVEAFNSVQSVVKFSSDATLQKALEQAVKAVGYTSSGAEKAVWEKVAAGTGETYLTYNTGVITNTATKTNTMLVVDRYGSSNALTEASAVVQSAADMAKAAVGYKDTNLADNQKDGSKYQDYTYTGSVAVASVTANTGVTVYFVAYTVTQNVTEQTYKPNV